MKSVVIRLRFEVEVKSIRQDQRQQGTTKAQCIYNMAEDSVQQPSQCVEAMWVEAPVGASHSSFPTA